MFQTKKQVQELKSEIGMITGTLKNNSEAVNLLSSELAKSQVQIKKNESSMNEFLKKLQENLNILEDLKDSFNKELYDFKVLKSQMQSKVMEKFEEELHKNLLHHNEDIKTSSKEYEQLKKDILLLSQKTVALSNEIDKFKVISNSIKKEDFELVKFAHELDKKDAEKLELMRKIDNLERIISKMRRSR